ncbi:hypothetical protein HDV00_009634 [Rhizophlyctis rosea]|nr:hypothetical protein HDV00_009634 [Rhizophlyctis rosea]
MDERLKDYIESQRVDPVALQLNNIHLEMIKSLDENRITDKTRYELQQVIRSGYFTQVDVPRIPDVGEIKTATAQANTPPNQFRVGDKAYQRFTFDPLYKIKELPPARVTFPVYSDEEKLGHFSKGFLHKHDVSLKDQSALNEIRKKQLGEEIDKVRKLEKSRSLGHDVVNQRTELVQDQIDKLANPLKVVTEANVDTDVSLVSQIPRQRKIETAPGVGNDVYEAVKYEVGIKRPTVAQKRRIGKMAPLAVDTTIKKPGYSLSEFTYPAEHYLDTDGNLHQTIGNPFRDYSLSLSKYVKDAWEHPVKAGQKL